MKQENKKSITLKELLDLPFGIAGEIGIIVSGSGKSVKELFDKANYFSSAMDENMKKYYGMNVIQTFAHASKTFIIVY